MRKMMGRGVGVVRRKTVGAVAQTVQGGGRRVTGKSINEAVERAQYAVRGALVTKAEEMKKEGRGPSIVPCNIGNPHAVGQTALTYHREFLGMVMYPKILDMPGVRSGLDQDIVAKVEEILKVKDGFEIGAYSTSQGLPYVRDKIRQFLQGRDGHPSSDDLIFCLDGASQGVRHILQMLIRGNGRDGIMVPIPQYPLYSALIDVFNGKLIPCYLEESQNWTCPVETLRNNLQRARDSGVDARSLVVINPGNPTGQVLTTEQMEEIVEFCAEEGLVLLADEVYQENIWSKTKPFVSFKKVACDLGYGCENMGVPHRRENILQLVSFHSTSKGFLGECGFRGGYMEVFGFDRSFVDQLKKLTSISLCSNIPGQLVTAMMTSPPQPGEASYETYNAEKSRILSSLERKSKIVYDRLNRLEGVSCNPTEGALYAFPQIELSQKAIMEAHRKGLTPDHFYADKMLEKTGVIVVPGSGFGQKEGTFHFRMTILPSEDELGGVMDRIEEFHKDFLQTYA